MTTTYTFYIDWRGNGAWTQSGGNVSARVQPEMSIRYGRDQARALSPIATGSTGFQLLNTSRDYSPENTSSALNGFILPARPILFQATQSSITYTLFRGHTDEFTVQPAIGERNVDVTGLDALAKLKEAKVSTELYSAKRTGEAIGIVLDAIGWPSADRDLDSGATTVKWWYVDGDDAWTAIEALVNAEGSPALITVDPDGKIVFRDRHHRLLARTLINENTDFESSEGLPGWGAFGGTAIQSDLAAHEGSVGCRFTPDGTTATVGVSSWLYAARPGESFTGSAWLKCAVSRSVGLSFNWYDSSSAYISTDSTSVSLTLNTWASVAGSFTAPANTAYVAITPTMTGTPAASNVLDMDQVELYGMGNKSQAIYRDTGTEPLFSAPMTYDQGWRDVVNKVSFSVDERSPSPDLTAIWTSDLTYSLTSGSTYDIVIQSNDPFYGAVTPVDGTDFQTRSGSASISLSRTSGLSTTLTITASGTTVIDSLQLRAYPVPVARTVQVDVEDTLSQALYGLRSWPNDTGAACLEDAKAVANLILETRAERLPIVSLDIVGSASTTRMSECLGRDLSDRVTIIDSQTGLSRDFYIEQIEHKISEAGLRHVTTFGCEAAPLTSASEFIFDDATYGKFGTGTFAAEPLDDTATMFIFDDPVNGKFGTGVFSI